MNSEELERSLRTEFEDYLNKAFAGMREDASAFQEKIQAAIEEHKSQMEAVFKEMTSRFEDGHELDEGFKESVVEHLRLARDEGARITAEAIAEAEKFDEENQPAAAAQEADFSELRDAISEISAQDSQADILKSLVNHASGFTPRGAFFIIKNEHFVGWRVFGKEEQENDQAIRDVFFPVSGSTLLGEATQKLETAEGSFASDGGDDEMYLSKLGFGQPDRMYAIPLVARGRGVAVLYADYGQEGTSVNVEALETLMKVAGLTVELLAASRGGAAKAQKEEQSEPAYAYDRRQEETAYGEESQTEETTSYVESEQPQVEETASSFEDEQPQTSDYGFSYQPSVEEEEPQQAEAPAQEFEYQDYAVAQDEPEDYESVSEVSETETTEYSSGFETYEPVNGQSGYGETASSEYQFDAGQYDSGSFDSQTETPVETSGYDASQFESFEQPAQSDFSESAGESSFDAYETAPSYSQATTQQETVTESVKTRFSDRNVDLPIEVGEDERRLHNDARRFARLLVSEIKLYNEQKVREGREQSDLYERLREAIDRSREMYDKRVQSPVSSKFDYFHYELVNSLAEGDENALGGSYPGASI